MVRIAERNKNAEQLEELVFLWERINDLQGGTSQPQPDTIQWILGQQMKTTQQNRPTESSS